MRTTLAALILFAAAPAMAAPEHFWNGKPGYPPPGLTCYDLGRVDATAYQVCDADPSKYAPELRRFIAECSDPTPACRGRLDRLRQFMPSLPLSDWR